MNTTNALMDLPTADGDVRLRVLTFNLWGIFNSKIRMARMKHFAAKVGNYDVLLLQEQFLEEDFTYIQSQIPETVRSQYYFRRFPSSFYGSGCAVISRYPIESTFFHTFPLQGYPEMVLHGDFFANKGVALTKIAVPNKAGGTVSVRLYTTHLVAVYTKVSRLANWRSERYLPYRISQAVSVADFVSVTSAPSDPILIGGDFNCGGDSLEVQIMLLLLKQRGYKLKSALPRPLPISSAPSALSQPQHSSGGSTSEGAITWPEVTPNSVDRSHAKYTFSDSNTYNTMSSSYFKLLKMQGDLPVQIDHIFFDAAHFEMESFEDCPDYEAPSIDRRPLPSLRQSQKDDEDSESVPYSTPPAVTAHTTAPTALVVLTKDEVPWPRDECESQGLAHRLMVQLSRLSRGHLPQFSSSSAAGSVGGGDNGAGFDSIGMSCRDAAPGAVEEMPLFPVSDHYGVATRLRLRSAPQEQRHTLLGSGSVSSFASPLTDEEINVVESVREVLRLTAERLRAQEHYSRVIAGVCGGIGLFALFQLLRDRSRHRRLIREALGLLQKAVTYFNEGEEAREAVDTLPGMIRRAGGACKGLLTSVFRRHGAVVEPTVTSGGERSLMSELNLAKVASSLIRPASAVYIFTVMSAPFLALASFSTGLLHRLGNAKLFEEQCRSIERVCYGLTPVELPTSPTTV